MRQWCPGALQFGFLFPYCLKPPLRKRDAGVPKTRAEVEVTAHGLSEEAGPFADGPELGATAALQLGDAGSANLSFRYSALLSPLRAPLFGSPRISARDGLLWGAAGEERGLTFRERSFCTLQRGRSGVWAAHPCLSPAPVLLPSALARHPHLCQTSWDSEGRHYPGFFCPRLSDTPEEAYCCHLQAAGGSCCTRAEFEALYRVNLSALPPAPLFR